MPYFEIKTNIEMDDTRAIQLGKEASALLSSLLGKPEKFIMVTISHSVPILFDGNGEPAAFVTLKSIGLPSERCKGYSEGICEFIETKLGIPSDRVYIDFADIKPKMFGWNGSTF